MPYGVAASYDPCQGRRCKRTTACRVMAAIVQISVCCYLSYLPRYPRSVVAASNDVVSLGFLPSPVCPTNSFFLYHLPNLLLVSTTIYTMSTHALQAHIEACELLIGYTFADKTILGRALNASGNAVMMQGARIGDNKALAIFGDTAMTALLCRQWLATGTNRGRLNWILSTTRALMSCSRCLGQCQEVRPRQQQSRKCWLHYRPSSLHYNVCPHDGIG